MSNIIRGRFGRFSFDAYNPSNIETCFEFLNIFDDVPLPDGNRYRIKNNEIQYLKEDKWEVCEQPINYFLSMVKDLTPSDWEEINKNSSKNNILKF